MLCLLEPEQWQRAQKLCNNLHNIGAHMLAEIRENIPTLTRAPARLASPNCGTSAAFYRWSIPQNIAVW